MFILDNQDGQVIKIIEQIRFEPGQGLMIFIGEKTDVDVRVLIDDLKGLGIVFFGGIFARVIFCNKSYDAGIIVKKIPLIGMPMVLKAGGLLHLDAEVLLGMGNTSARPTAYILADGLSPNVSELLTTLYNKLGNEVHFIGAGAGSLTFNQANCVFTRDGFYQDALVMGITPLYSQPGVRHGWQRIQGPIVVSKAEHNRIKELNWAKAYDAYHAMAECNSGRTLKEADFFNWAKEYPFGILREGFEDIVRDPIATNSAGELVCVGEVPENALLFYLKGTKETLIQAAKEAVRECIIETSAKPMDCLVVDCISRVLFLGDDFHEELSEIEIAIKHIDSDLTVEGVLSLGEISTFDGVVEFFNKTVVVGVLYGEQL